MKDDEIWLFLVVYPLPSKKKSVPGQRLTHQRARQWLCNPTSSTRIGKGHSN